MIPDAFLVSAYDLHHGHIAGISDLGSYPVDGPLGAPALLFVDSGGYETRESYDLSEVYRHPYNPEPWDEDRLEATVANFSTEIPLVIVNFDRPGPFTEQIRRARSFFEKHPSFMRDLLVKPHSDDANYLDIKKLMPEVKEFAHFDFLGVTEKELGNRLLDRLELLARLRIAMDQAGVSTPIHVFGSLDPLISPMYFLAGAEIFDGLSWLRYAYRDGVAMYGEALAVLQHQLEDTAATRRSRMLANNLDAIRRMAISLRASMLGDELDYAKLLYHARLYEEVHDALRTRVEGL
jgi:hypothetical protein